MADSDLESAKAEFLRAVGRALEARLIPAKTVSSGSIRITPKDLLDFDGGIEPVEAERLVRIIVNASNAAGRVRAYIREVRMPNITATISSSAAIRYAVVLSNSLEDLSKLIGGDEYKVRTPDWRKVVTEADDNDDEEKSEAHPRKLTELDAAFVYQRLKQIREDWFRQHINCDNAMRQLLEVMEELKNGSSS